MKKSAVKLITLILAMCLVLGGCANGAKETTPTPAAPAANSGSGNAGATAQPSEGVKSSKDIVVVANTAGEPGNLHPYNTNSVGGGMVFTELFDRLMLEKGGEMTPSLATKWDVKDDGFTFYLRQDVTFHNGDKLTAEDVVFSIQELILKSTGGLAQSYVSIDAENVKAIDEYTVYVPLKKVDSSVFGYFSTLFIVPKKAYQEMGDDFQFKPVGSGAYKFKDWTVGDHITLEANENYWGGPPLIKTITYRTIGEAAQAMIELETGGVDIVINPSGADVVRVNNGEVKGVKAVSKGVALRNNILNFNFNSEYIRNDKVRQAIAHSIDRESWTPVISPGVGIPNYSILATGIWGYDDSLGSNYAYPYDLEKAKALLAEAGYTSGCTLVLLTDNRPYHIAAVDLLQNTMKQIGITLDVKTMELAQQKEIMATGKGYDLYTMDNLGQSYDGLSPIWGSFHPMFATENSPNNHFNTVDIGRGQEFADLMDEILATLDDAKRLELMKKLQKMFTEDILSLPINCIQPFLLTNETLQNVSFDKDVLFITADTYFN